MDNIDKIYQEKKDKIEPFAFNKQTSAIFDNMAKRSIPLYNELQVIIAKIIVASYKPETYFYDIGCSTGNTIIELFKHTNNHIKIIAIDNSKEMIEIAKSKCAMLTIKWISAGVENMPFDNASVINAAYVLQFIRPQKREKILKTMYKGLIDGGTLILSEKTITGDTETDNLFSELYDEFKLKNNYSKLEIEQKKAALKDVLIPFSQEHYVDLLTKIGFRKIHIIVKYLNFMTVLAVK
ncbi:MAG: hypothetical protein DKM50_11340 [Candidatus Margulisiibacteriota bacterium]|nr:MAG: hypothetical protein A2X43_12170 [Candidatus Margulisbacteria bacterium GWD2_39_127]OGI03212.1 MAG: hypothetical protein A2X42_11410 [Candidatus Margulisbacteria bacterium GWF2_38_17]OGI11236.1 MAG: hypothetical protein A2X41_03835 [Candidatus Margulisbacteria bacterium GWE2_39_32]PZM78549.1 MAG: hypothetical protein DKM50_11340 [Candidatus Margulisiibacteriota bacterium]HAR63884.1 hypothetical protein [Candidatus Margulisiibacteriota bacterium]